jgi:hypothetical protein
MRIIKIKQYKILLSFHKKRGMILYLIFNFNLLLFCSSIFVKGQNSRSNELIIPNLNVSLDSTQQISKQLKANYLLSASVNPIVVKANLDTFSLSIKVSSSDIKKITLKQDYLDIKIKKDITAPIELFDDGTHGDLIKNDKIFMRSGLEIGYGLYYISPWDLIYEFIDGHSETINEPLGIFIVSVDASQIDNSPIISLAPDVSAMSNVVSIVGSKYDFGGTPVDAPQIDRYYSFFPDDRDFLILCNTDYWPYQIGGTHCMMSNSIQGIGFPIVSSNQKYNLHTIIGLDYGFNNITITHEILHDWAAYLAGGLNEGTGHWSPIISPSSGFGGPAVMKEINHTVGNTYEVIRQDNYKYSNLELYLMGLADINEINFPLRYLINSQFLSWNTFTGDSIVEMTKEKFLALNGERIPTYSNSQKKFTAAFIVMSDRKLSNTEFGFFNFLAKNYPQYFSDATSSRGQISTELHPKLTTNVDEHLISDSPLGYCLFNNYPNPFYQSTSFMFSIPVREYVSLKIFDFEGNQVASIVSEELLPGNHSREWNSGQLPRGTYFYRLQAGSFTETKKLILFK